MKRLIKWLGRIALGVLSVVVVMVAVFAVMVISDSINGSKTEAFTNVRYQGADGQSLIGYLAEPAGEGPFPGILLIHEWWGLNEGMTILADALAEEGYVVLAPDAYRNRVTSNIARAIWLVTTTPQQQIFADVDAALAHLMSLDKVDTERLATMGFCFGGGQSLQLGMRQSQNLPLTIIYYGALVTDPSLLKPLTEGKAVLGVFAGEDRSIARDDVLEFEAALNSLDISNDITIYEGVGHGFVSEDNYDQPGPAGDAWQQTLDFLAANFKEN